MFLVSTFALLYINLYFRAGSAYTIPFTGWNFRGRRNATLASNSRRMDGSQTALHKPRIAGLYKQYKRVIREYVLVRIITSSTFIYLHLVFI